MVSEHILYHILIKTKGDTLGTVIPEFRRPRQEEFKLEASPGYIVRPCLKKRMKRDRIE
jgi:hypothetical protein